MKQLHKLRKFKKSGAVLAAIALTAVAAPRVRAAGSAVIDLTPVGTDGLNQVTSGGTAATPIFGGMIAIGLVTAAFRRVAH